MLKVVRRIYFIAVNGNYNLCSQSDFGVPGINTVFYGANSIRYFGSVIWNSFSNDLRNIGDFDLFKTTIQRWKPVDCPCSLCKNYLDGLGFIAVLSYFTRKFTQVFLIMFCKNEITILIAMHLKFVCENNQEYNL